MSSAKDINSEIFIKTYADYLKRSGKLDHPSWIEIVKTGKGKKTTPNDQDWYYIRVASLVRKFYINGSKGVGGLSKEYGCRKRNGSKPGHKANGSRKILRYILQQLEKLDIIYKSKIGKRELTKKARQDIDIRASKISKVVSINK
mmetsp:Transcript_46650/g.73025  ORF Transcript_46650/g.73025 Transcript_46650/m.73025 type:complete len:145 (-) Transcript_46650:2274-2708(-)